MCSSDLHGFQRGRFPCLHCDSKVRGFKLHHYPALAHHAEGRTEVHRQKATRRRLPPARKLVAVAHASGWPPRKSHRGQTPFRATVSHLTVMTWVGGRAEDHVG